MEKNLTTGNIFKTIVYFALPYLLSYFLQTLYGMADLFIIGQFDHVDAITAVSNGSQVMHMLTVIIVGLDMAQPLPSAGLSAQTGSWTQPELSETRSHYSWLFPFFLRSCFFSSSGPLLY